MMHANHSHRWFEAPRCLLGVVLLDGLMRRPNPCQWFLGGCLLAAIGCQPSPPAIAPPPPKVTVQLPVTREIRDYRVFNGTTVASAIVEVRSRVRGYIQQVHFEDGQIVKPGDLLFELDPRPFQVEINAAKDQLELNQAQLDAAAADEARQRDLYAKNATSKADFDRAVAQRKSWDARIDLTKQDIIRRELDLEYSRITAPIGGRIGRALLTAGNLVNAGGSDPLLTTIMAIDPIDVVFNVDERTLLEYRQQRRNGETAGDRNVSLRERQVPFEFGLETDRGFPNQGLLRFADNRIDISTGTIEVRGTAANSEGLYVPGSRVRVRLALRDPHQGLTAPDTAILSDLDKKYILVLNPQNVVVRRDVVIGSLLDDGMREITAPLEKPDSLSADEPVIVLGLQRARLNYPVEPVDQDGNPFVREPAKAETSVAAPASTDG
jgi:RND family efflux transporter MFP subunit